MSTRYLFHVHARAPQWRLVLREGAAGPAGYVAADWSFTRARGAEDVNPDVRAACDAEGYCLFKIGGTFDEVAADVARRGER